MTAALIIASGTRTNRAAFEPGQKIGTISAIKRIVLLFQKAGIREIVVCGAEEEVKKLVPSMNVVFLPCPPDREMIEYIQMGIGYLQKKARQIFVAPVSVPAFSHGTLSALQDAGGTVCIPSCHGKRGHPVLLRSECFQDILQYSGEHGLKAAIDGLKCEKTTVEVEDAGIIGHIPARKETAPHSDQDGENLNLSWKFRIRREEIFYGPGIHQLLHLIAELHSLSDACRYMGISYSKGRKIIQTFEQQMNCPVLITQQGGRGGGCSQLTDQAKDMMQRFDAFEAEAGGLLRILFDKYFGDIQ